MELALLVLLVACGLALANWRQAFYLCVLTALLQDPFRKLVAGQPIYFIVFVGAVFAAACVGATVAKVRLAPHAMLGWRHYVGTPFLIFVLLLCLQFLYSLLRFGNPIVAAIGLMSYVAPIPAIVLAYRFAISRGGEGILSWMRFYVVAATVALITVYLEYAGVGWQVLGEVGGGVMLSGSGAYYHGNAGTFRAAEIAAWHAATVACFSFILFWGRRFSPPKLLLALAFILFLLGLGALTGRRKMVIEVAIFLSAYFALVLWFSQRSGRMVVVCLLAGVLGYAWAVGAMSPDTGDGTYASERVAREDGNTFDNYRARAGTAFEDLPRRVMELGVMPVSWAVDAEGWLGGGLGIGSQGATRFGAQSNGAAEGGLGKITVELGVPGLVVCLWLLAAVARYAWHVLDFLQSRSQAHANVGFGLVAFILANVAAFSVATQAYADVFILLAIGWSFGYLLALPVLVQVGEQARNAGSAVPGPRPAAPKPSLARP